VESGRYGRRYVVIAIASSSRQYAHRTLFATVYAYLPAQNKLCSGNSTSSQPPTPSASIICNDDYGTSLSRGSFVFVRGGYTQIIIFVRMNTAPKKRNGIIRVWVNGQSVLDMEDLILSGVKPNEPLR